MGCGGSSCANGQEKNKTGLQLMTSKLYFQVEQLKRLDEYFKQLARRDYEASPDAAEIESAVERLVQRLVVGVGNLDHRFATTFLVSLNEPRRLKQLRFEYLLRLDALSRPSGQADRELPLSLEEDSALPGFARLRLRTGDAGPWAEFLGTDGRLRRDLVKARVATLLAAAMRPDAINGADERLCMSPGQVVDAEVLDKIFKQPEHCRVFFGPADSESKLPEVGEHRVAIVEDESGVVLKICLNGSTKSQDVEVRLLIGASVNSWPSCADYPKRIPLYHCDALLHYTAAQTGMYVVAVAPHQGLRCEDRASLWRVRLPAAETIMRQHYCDESVPALVETALFHVLDQLRGRLPSDFSARRKGSLRLVSRHIVRAIHWWSLERTGPDLLKLWAPDRLAQHVLLSLDELLRALKCQNLRCYFEPRCNLMLQCARGGLVQSEDLYAADGRLLESYLSALQAYSFEWLEQAPEPQPSSSELLEEELLSRWRQVRAALPRAGPPGEQCGYTGRQLQYLGLVLEEALRAKERVLEAADADAWGALLNASADSQASESTENLLYLLSLALRQAREQAASQGRRPRRRGRRSRAERRRSCARAFFQRSVETLLEVVRRDRETAYLDLEEALAMPRALLRWLQYAAEADKRVLGPLLRPYLASLAASARENACHLESWRRRQDGQAAEMRSLGLFCKLVSARELLPANGLVDALSRGWAWAEALARAIERSAERGSGLGLVFLAPERILRFQLKFAEDKGPGSYSTWSKARSIGSAARRASIARASLISATDTLPGLVGQARKSSKTRAQPSPPPPQPSKEVASHVELRDASPLTFVGMMARRRGRQRGPGGLIPALVTLNKFRVLQEVAQVLPAKERTAMLELVQRVQRGAARRQRRASCPDQLNQFLGNEPRQVYTPRSESRLQEAPARDSPQSRQRRIILERQLQLRREILEIHDTLSRGLRSRRQLPSWDSMSMASSTLSSGSIGRGKLRKQHRMALWADGTLRGTSSLWDSVSCNSTFTRVKPGRAALKPDVFASNHANSKDALNNGAGKDCDGQKLPSWEALERALNKKISTSEYDNKPNLQDDNKDVNVEYIIVGNDTKELPR